MKDKNCLSPEDKKVFFEINQEPGVYDINDEVVDDVDLISREEYDLRPDDYEHYFYTYDLGLSAALVTTGFDLFVTLKNSKKAQFIFRRKEGIDKAIKGYWSNQLEVKARSLVDNTKMLKNRLYSDN